ncbi:MAG TPA: hypothetical protein VGJ00_07395 [Rhabdochlamydiaceae bacterium]|jgi:hypothetical protein
MVNINEINYIDQSQWLHANMQSIANELDTPSNSNKKFSLLSRKLDTAFKVIDHMKRQSASHPLQKGAIAEVEGKMITLVHRVVTAQEQQAVQDIQTEAHSIERSLTSGGKVTAKAVDKLAKHITTFNDHHRPYKKERQIIAEAQHIMRWAQNYLKGLPSPAVNTIPRKDLSEANPQEYDQLYAIAGLLHKNDISGAKALYQQLPEAYRNRFLEHVSQLGTTPFSTNTVLASIQALFATVNDIVGNGEGYPTQAYVENFFSELNQLPIEGTASHNNIISFNAYLSRTG